MESSSSISDHDRALIELWHEANDDAERLEHVIAGLKHAIVNIDSVIEQRLPANSPDIQTYSIQHHTEWLMNIRKRTSSSGSFSESGIRFHKHIKDHLGYMAQQPMHVLFNNLFPN